MITFICNKLSYQTIVSLPFYISRVNKEQWWSEEKVTSMWLKIAKFVATVMKSIFKPQNIYINAVLKGQNTKISKAIKNLKISSTKLKFWFSNLGEKFHVFCQKLLNICFQIFGNFGRKKSWKQYENRQLWSHWS